MAAAATKLGHALRILAVFRAVLAEFTVGGNRTGTTRVSALLRLGHLCLLLCENSEHCRTSARARRGQLSGAFRDRGSPLFAARPSFALPLGAQDAAPLLVLADGHAALDTDAHPRPG